MNNGKSIPVSITDSAPYIEFNSDGSFNGRTDLGTQEGTWFIENGNKENRVILNQKKDTTIMYLEELSKEQLVWRIEDDELRLRFYSKTN